MPRKNRYSRSAVKRWKDGVDCRLHLVLSDSSVDSDNSEGTVLSAVVLSPSAVPCSSAVALQIVLR